MPASKYRDLEEILMNKIERETFNRNALCNYMEKLNQFGDLSRLYLPTSGEILCASTDDGDYVIDAITGDWAFSDAGENKSNKRAY